MKDYSPARDTQDAFMSHLRRPVTAQAPTSAEYAAFRSVLGWPPVGQDAARRALDASWWVGTVYDPKNGLTGLVRVIGDGALSFYIADVMVHPDARGLGDSLLQAAIDVIRPAAVRGATVAVIPIQGTESFYERHGFVSAPPFGPGMVWAEPLRGLLER